MITCVFVCACVCVYVLCVCMCACASGLYIGLTTQSFEILFDSVQFKKGNSNFVTVLLSNIHLYLLYRDSKFRYKS